MLALYGAWGAGKTSIVNLVNEELTKEDPKPLLVAFNPWEWSGHEELATALFREIELALPSATNREAASAAEKLRAYAAVLEAGVTLADAVPRLAMAVGSVLVAAGAGTLAIDFVSSKWVGLVVVALGALALALSQVRRVTDSLAAVVERGSPTQTKSLDAAKKELAEALRTYSRTMLVVVDDIDRLTPPDAVRMLQLIKANTDLPGLVFLLAFDRDSVAKSVQAALSVDGIGYLEKVIQVGFDVPAPDVVELGELLVEGVNNLLQSPAILTNFDVSRWQDLYVNGLLPLLNTPRRVIRFVSMVTFVLARYVERDQCNVDPVDFIAVEALREFEPELYQSIRGAKRVLTGPSTGATREQEATKQEIGPILQLAKSSKAAPAAERIVRQLFPAAEWTSTGVGQAVDRNRALNARRVSHEQMFDRYFQFTVPSRDLSEGQLTETVQLATGDQAELVHALRALMARGLMRVFLTRLQAATDLVPRGAEVVFIAGLFDVGDELEGQVERVLEASEILLAQFLIEDLLEREPTPERIGLLRSAVERSSGVALPFEVVELQLHRHERDRTPVIEEEPLKVLAAELVPRIPVLAEEKRLLNHRHLAALLYAWGKWAEGEAKTWAEEVGGSPAGLARLVRAFQHYTREDGEHPLVKFIDLASAKDRARIWLNDQATEAKDRESFEELLAPPSAFDRIRASAKELDTEQAEGE